MLDYTDSRDSNEYLDGLSVPYVKPAQARRGSARAEQKAARDAGGGVELELAIRIGLERGYKLSDLLRIHAAEGSVQRTIGDAQEAAVRRSVARTKRLPCGEPVRINHRTIEKDTWLMFQFSTGTHGDSLGAGSGSTHKEGADPL
jgi:hypothetical protein